MIILEVLKELKAFVTDCAELVPSIKSQLEHEAELMTEAHSVGVSEADISNRRYTITLF